MNNLNDYDLRNKQYSIEELIKNIDNLSIKTLIYTQILTPEFCKKYILAPGCACSTEEEYISIDDVLRAQPHIKKEML